MLSPILAQFIKAGQNLHLGGNKPDFPKPESVITDAINGWYGEIKDATQSDIDKYGKSTK